MKTFPADFIVEKDRVAGSKPRTIFVVRLVTGVLYLSDQSFPVTNWAGEGSPVTQAWVSDWGAVDLQVSGLLGAPRLSDFGLTMIDDPNDASRWSVLIDDPANNPYQTDCELYLWFADLDAATAPPQMMWKGTFLDRGEAQGELLWRHRFQDELLMIDKPIGRTLNRGDFPGADPDDIGRFVPIIIGAVEQSPALSIVAGGQSLLVSALAESQATVQVSDASVFPSVLPFVIRAENEEMNVTAKGATPEIFVVTRAFNGTVGIAHDAGQSVWEVRNDFTYLASDRLMQSIDRVFVEVRDEIWDITGAVTMFPGGNASFPNQAVVVAPAKLTVEQAVSIEVVKTGGVVDNIGVSDNLAITQVASAHFSTNTVNVTDLSSSNLPVLVEFASQASGAGGVDFFFPALPPGTFVKQIITVSTRFVQLGDSNSPNRTWLYTWQIGNSPNTGTTFALNPTFQLQDTSGATVLKLRPADIGAGNNLISQNGTVEVISAVRSVSVIQAPVTTANLIQSLGKTAPAVKTGTIADTIGFTQGGNSTADITVGGRVLVSGRGIQDDGSGTYTGTPNALITRPDHVCRYWVNTELGIPLASFVASPDFGTETINVDVPLVAGHVDPFTGVSLNITSGEVNPLTGVIYVANDLVRLQTPIYQLHGVISRKQQASRWLTQWAWQSRSYFFMSAGRAVLQFRPDVLVSAKTVTSANVRQTGSVSTLRRRWSGLLDVINVIEVFGDKAWRKTGVVAESYQQSSKGSNSASITKYGQRERPGMWLFDFITDPALLIILRDFYLARHKDERRQLICDVFLDQAEVDFADAITLQHPLIPSGSSVGEVIETNYRPGSGRDGRTDLIQLTMQEH